MRAYRIAYDGQPYHGFQRQPDVPTVEGALFAALRALDVLASDVEKPPGYAGAGRTDAGVSAVRQTVAFEAPDWLSPAALNSELPASIRAWASADAPPEFHATHDATEREYTYFLYAPETDTDREDGITGMVPGESSFEASERRARQALDALSGEHDFHNLTPDDEGTRRRLSTALKREGSFLVVTLRAGGFPRQLVRRVVSLVASVARGDVPLDHVERVLSAESLQGPDGIAPARPEPLVLTDVAYPDLAFQVDAEAADRTRDIFARLHAEHTSSARVAAMLAGLGDTHREA